MILKTEQLEYLYSYQLYKIEKNPNKKEIIQESNQDSIINNKKFKKDDSYFQESNSKYSIEANKVPANKNKEDNENLQSDILSSNISKELNGFDVSQIVNEGNDNSSYLQRKSSCNNTENIECYCKICNKMQNSKIKLQKCYSAACKNVFCQDCFSRNHYQTRAASCSCTYFDCDFCGKKKICIMSTIFCGPCDKRACSNCYYQQHVEHGNIKIFGK
jgi:hypothetical protein